MTRLSTTAAALALLTTSAAAQVLQPIPLTPMQAYLQNLSAIAVYAATCKRDDPDYQPGGRIGLMISYSFNSLPTRYMMMMRRTVADAQRFASQFASPQDYCDFMQAALQNPEQ